MYEDWVASEFTYPLRALLWGSTRDRRAHMLLNLVVVAGGFAVSGIAAAAGQGGLGGHASWIVFGIGLIVALVGGANQLFRPAARATKRIDIAAEMRDEGWAFALAIPPHYSGDDRRAFHTFQKRISLLRRRMFESTALDEAGVQAKPGAEAED